MSLARRAWPSYLFLTFSLGFLGPISCGDGASSDEGGSEVTDGACIEGHEGCPCAEGDLCLGGLTCASGLCVDLGGDDDAATSSSGTMGTTSAGDGDSTGSTTTDTSGGDGDTTASTSTDTSGGDGDSTGSTTTDTSGGDGDSTGSTTSDTSGGDGDSTGSTTSTSSDTSGGDGDSTGSTTSTTSGGDGDGGNNDGCDSGFTCTKALPLNWQGPVILNEASGSAPSCGGGYPTQIDLKNKDLDFSDAECTCICGEFATNVTCRGELHVVSNDSCSGLEPSPGTINSGTCQYATVNNGESLAVRNSYVHAGSCTAAVSENIPNYTWGSQGRVCEASGSSWDTCQGTASDVCVPDTDRVCVYRNGAHSCPMWYPYKHELYDTAVDTRDCSSCSCAAENDCALTDVWVYPGNADFCNTPQWDNLTPESGCHDPGSAGVNSVYWDTPPLGCGVDVEPLAEGTVAPQGAATVCCNAP